MPSLRSSICHIKIMKSYILNNFFFFMNITFWNCNIFLSLEIVFSCIWIWSTNALYCSGSCFNINDITNSNFFFLNIFINTWIQFQLLLTFCSFKTNYYWLNYFPITSMGIFYFFWRYFNNFSFPYFFCFFNS